MKTNIFHLKIDGCKTDKIPFRILVPFQGTCCFFSGGVYFFSITTGGHGDSRSLSCSIWASCRGDELSWWEKTEATNVYELWRSPSLKAKTCWKLLWIMESWYSSTCCERQAVRPSTPGIAGQGPCEDRPDRDLREKWDFLIEGHAFLCAGIIKIPILGESNNANVW